MDCEERSHFVRIERPSTGSKMYYNLPDPMTLEEAKYYICCILPGWMAVCLGIGEPH